MIFVVTGKVKSKSRSGTTPDTTKKKTDRTMFCPYTINKK